MRNKRVAKTVAKILVHPLPITNLHDHPLNSLCVFSDTLLNLFKIFKKPLGHSTNVLVSVNLVYENAIL